MGSERPPQRPLGPRLRLWLEGAGWGPAASATGLPAPPQLIYNAGVSFMAIMFAWSGLACLIFLNCAFNWPREAFPSPEEVNYK